MCNESELIVSMLPVLNHRITGLDCSLGSTHHKPRDTNEHCLKHLSLDQRLLDIVNYNTQYYNIQCVRFSALI